MRYDAAIIGAGAEGLAAAAMLGKAGLRVRVIERNERVGGRCLAREFHPGFFASPFADAFGDVPSSIFWALDLARHGAVFAPPHSSLALWSDRQHLLALGGQGDSRQARLLEKAQGLRAAIVERTLRNSVEPPAPTHFFRRKPKSSVLPGAEWSGEALGDLLADIADDGAGHLAALALCGTAADPTLFGSGLHLLSAGAQGGLLPGSRLSQALYSAAEAAGVEFSLGLEATDILRKDGRIVGVCLADGTEIATRSVISTLDLKRTFLSFFAWNALPKPLLRQVNAFRMAGATARILFALDRAPEFAVAPGAPIHIAPSLEQTGQAYRAWRAGIISETPPITLRVLSDPSAAPAACAVVTATVGAMPFRLFDGGWTYEKREQLRQRTLAAIESVSPGFSSRVVGAEVVAPPDIEDALGATEGDLTGGEISGDQMLGAELWGDPPMPRTPIAGLYLAGSYLSAGAFATCAAGTAAANALLSDRGRRK